MGMRAAILVTMLGFLLILDARPLSAQAEFRSGRFTTSDGIELHYLEAGSGPTLVFVPGWTMPAEIWEPQLRHFALTHRVVALDPRGQGRSQKPTEGYHSTRRALDIGELLEHLGGAPAVVAGWSLGVQEVLVYADEFGTEALRAAVLVDFPIEFDLQNLTELTTSRITNLQVDRESWTRQFVRAMYRSEQSDEYLESITRAALSTPTNAAALMIANVLHVGPVDLGPAVDGVDRPVLFVASSQPWAVAQAEMVRERWPDVRVEVIENTGHALFVDEPEQFNQVLEEFLAVLPHP